MVFLREPAARLILFLMSKGIRKEYTGVFIVNKLKYKGNTCNTVCQVKSALLLRITGKQTFFVREIGQCGKGYFASEIKKIVFQ